MPRSRPNRLPTSTVLTDRQRRDIEKAARLEEKSISSFIADAAHRRALKVLDRKQSAEYRRGYEDGLAAARNEE